MALKIRKGDTVLVFRGRAKGEEGKVSKVMPDKGSLIIEGVNLMKKHQRMISENKPHGIIEIPVPVRISNVKLVCPKCNEPTRVGFSFDEDGNKHRVCKKCGEVID